MDFPIPIPGLPPDSQVCHLTVWQAWHLLATYSKAQHIVISEFSGQQARDRHHLHLFLQDYANAIENRPVPWPWVKWVLGIY